MSCNDQKKEAKLLQFKIKGQKRPSIDKNLQIYNPGQEGSLENGYVPSFSPLYAPYLNKSNSLSPLAFVFPIDSSEFKRAMDEADQAYLGWKKMQDHLKSIIKNWKN